MYRSHSCQNLLLPPTIKNHSLTKSKNIVDQSHSNSNSNCYFNGELATNSKSIFFQEFYCYFRELATFLDFKLSHIQMMYITSPKNTIMIMGLIKYADELDQHATKLEIPKAKRVELKENIVSIVDKIRNSPIQPDESNKFSSQYNSLYYHFTNYKNREILNDAQTILEEMNKVILPHNAQFSAPQISLLDLQNKNIVVSNKSSYRYKDLYNLEEEPYMKEHRILNLISSMWEVKNIVNLEEDQQCLSALKKITALNVFINLSYSLRESKNLNKDLKINITKFKNLASKILDNESVMQQISDIKQGFKNQPL